jgi:hypothetical protein
MRSDDRICSSRGNDSDPFGRWQAFNTLLTGRPDRGIPQPAAG